MKNIHLGLCCLFVDEPIHFKTVTLRTLRNFGRPRQLLKLSEICVHNASELAVSVSTAYRLGIDVFRISSALFPLATHPEAGYELANLPNHEEIFKTLGEVRSFSQKHRIRLSLHPDQFVVPVSPDPAVAASSIRELRHQLMIAELTGASEINLHMGGVYGDKNAVIRRFAQVFESFPDGLQKRLTLENDDRSYTVSDLCGICRDLDIPLVYDVHHHRCNQDSFSIEEATAIAAETWRKSGLTPHFHISSPKNGWAGPNIRPHADYIDPKDFPDCWRVLDAAVDVEAKAKEKAVVRLREDLCV